MMNMTHYMGLLADNQPWNLLLFMAVPVILAETVAITELYVLFTRNFTGTARLVNRVAGILWGIYFTGVFAYLFATAVVPLTTAGEWRGAADVIAVGAYLLGVVPLAGIALSDLWLVGKGKTELERYKIHVVCVAGFLVVAHIAMIFGMLDPAVLGYDPAAKMAAPMSGMEGMAH